MIDRTARVALWTVLLNVLLVVACAVLIQRFTHTPDELADGMYRPVVSVIESGSIRYVTTAAPGPNREAIFETTTEPRPRRYHRIGRIE